MPRKEPHEKIERPLPLEKIMYPAIEEYFMDKKDCTETGSCVSKTLTLSLFGSQIYPDVYGVVNPTKDDFKIFMAEGKLDLKGREFDICKGQGLSLQRFADYVYTFFPKESWNTLERTEQTEVIEECKKLKLGLLIVEGKTCLPEVDAEPGNNLVTEENRRIARDRIVNYFPDYITPKENSDFFQKHVELADSIVQDSHSLIRDLGKVFKKVTGLKKISIKPWYGDRFEFYYESYRRTGEIYLAISPFGDPESERNAPTLFIQQEFKPNIFKNNENRQKLEAYMVDCLKRKGIIVLTIGDLIYTHNFTDNPKEIFAEIERPEMKDLSVFDQVEILGVKKEQISREVEKLLVPIISLRKSLKAGTKNK
jgi:hypothetical protein